MFKNSLNDNLKIDQLIGTRLIESKEKLHNINGQLSYLKMDKPNVS